MNTNAERITLVIEYIENHLTEKISLDDLADAAGYSKYHLHRMFTGIIGLSVQNYIKRRKLTESAKKLLFTDEGILTISLEAGYQSQQAFTLAFKRMYKKTPLAYRKKHEFHPLQLKFNIGGNISGLQGDRIMDIKIIDSESIHLAGCMGNTRYGFQIIGRLWHSLHKVKAQIPNRTHTDYVVGLNDYTKDFSYEGNQTAFDYYAAVEVSMISEKIPSKLKTVTLPAGKYAVFTFRGKPEDSLQPVIDYIYKIWFPQSNCQLNEHAKYDFARYGERVDTSGQSNIEVWIPII